MRGFMPWHRAVLDTRRFLLFPRIKKAPYGMGWYVRWGRKHRLVHAPGWFA